MGNMHRNNYGTNVDMEKKCLYFNGGMSIYFETSMCAIFEKYYFSNNS